jgi:hypothetical protein
MEDTEKQKTFIDPPSGWLYGFPKELPDDIKDVRQWLIDNGYPENLVDFGMQHLKFWVQQ